jgi:hypothetical protein
VTSTASASGLLSLRRFIAMTDHLAYEYP